jgi:hypothetical protein
MANASARQVTWEGTGTLKPLPWRPEHPSMPRLAEVSFPVLLPDLPPDTPVVYTAGEGWYAASYKHGDLYVIMQGTRMAVDDPRFAGVAPFTPSQRTVTRMDGIAELTWMQFGVSYTLDLECPHPLTNPICTEDDTLVALAEGLRLLDTPTAREAR